MNWLLIVLCMCATVQRNHVWGTHERLFADCVAGSPDKPRTWLNLGQAMQEQQRYGEAIQDYGKADLLGLESMDPHVKEVAQLLASTNISDVYIRLGRPDIAHEVIRQSWIKYPGFPGLALNLSKFYLTEKTPEPEKAIAFLSFGIEEMPAYPWFSYGAMLYQNRGVAWELMGDCGAANADYAMARMDPDAVRIMPCIEKGN